MLTGACLRSLLAPRAIEASLECNKLIDRLLQGGADQADLNFALYTKVGPSVLTTKLEVECQPSWATCYGITVYGVKPAGAG